MKDLPDGHTDKRSAGLPVMAARLAAAAIPCWLTLSFVTTSSAPVELRAMVGIVAVLSAIYPTEGLYVVAAIVPFGDLISMALESPPVRLAEAIAVAFLAGCLISPRSTPDRGPVPGAIVRAAGFALTGLILASAAAVALQVKAHVPAMWPALFTRTYDQYFAAGPDAFGAIAGGRLIEGLGLSAAVVLLLRRRPILAVLIPQALGAGCVVAVVAAYLLWYGVAFPAVLARYSLIGERIVAHVADINAAGSYFALMLFVAAGMAGREGGQRRLGWAAVVASAAAGLWLSASRSAMAAVGLTSVCAAIWWTSHRWHMTTRYVVLAFCAVVLAGATLLPVMDTYFDATGHGARYRIEFAESSYRMIRSYRWLGFGIGQYYQASPMFLNAQLAWAYGSENAHNYFMQVAAEIGLLGFAACIALIAEMLRLVARAMARTPDNYRLLGLGCGVVAFLVTCTTGHPFLTPEVVFPFWLVAGLAVALSAPTAPRESAVIRRLSLPVMAACAIALAASVPVRAREAPPGPRHGLAVEGLFDWEMGEGGRYRWSEEYASVFVGREARRVEIPVRAPRQERDTDVAADVSVDGNRAVRWPIGHDWTSVTVDLPDTSSIVQARRINIRSSRVRSLADGRTVGLQLGAPRVLEP
jgi:O-antigen ligase